jgi:predicted RNase H-like HicB family nuclease
MRVKVVVHEAEEGGAEVPAVPGCVSQADTMDDLLANIGEAIHAWLEAEAPAEGGSDRSGRGRVVELTL